MGGMREVKSVEVSLSGKKAIVIGERDGVPAPAIVRCLETAGAEVVLQVTECFV